MFFLILKCLLGAFAVLLIALASRSRYFFLAGLVPLFPTFALLAHYVVGTTRTTNELQATALFGLWSLTPYAAYLITVYFLSTRISLLLTLCSAAAMWLICAALILGLWYRVFPTA